MLYKILPSRYVVFRVFKGLGLLLGPAMDATQFTPYSIKDLGPSFVNQYVLSNWWLIPSTMKGGKTRTMEMVLVLKRKFSNIFVVTYLPTILMNIINQAINYITHDNKVIDKEHLLAIISYPFSMTLF